MFRSNARGIVNRLRAADRHRPLRFEDLENRCLLSVATLSPSQDNTLIQSSVGNLSDGAGEFFFVGRTSQPAGLSVRRGLIAFDIADIIPRGATINSVQLTLGMSKTVSGAQTVGLYRAMADWGEGTSNAGANEGTGAAATTGDATWVHSFFPSTNWTTPGGDFNPVPSATTTVGGVGFYTWASTPALVADVQGWLDDPGTNFGWGVASNESAARTAKRFNSSENGNPSTRPVLTVDDTPFPGPSLAISNAAVTSGTSGTADAVFTVTLSEAVNAPVTVDFATSDGTATLANQDYVANSGTLTIPANQLSGTITVTVNGDPVFESNETFFVTLSNAGGVNLARPKGRGTIQDFQPATTIGLYDPSAGQFYLTNQNSSSLQPSDVNAFGFPGVPSYFVPVSGDWNNQGTDTIGLYDPVNAHFYLKNSNVATGNDLISFGFEGLGIPSTWRPLAGDWDGDGTDTIGLYDPVNAHFYLKNSNMATGNDLVSFGFEGLGIPSTWRPLAGDWTDQGEDTIGFYDPAAAHFYLANQNASNLQSANVNSFGFPGVPSYFVPLVGDWDASGTDTIGLYDPFAAHFYLKNSNVATGADLVSFGFPGLPSSFVPIAGHWQPQPLSTVLAAGPAAASSTGAAATGVASPTAGVAAQVAAIDSLAAERGHPSTAVAMASPAIEAVSALGSAANSLASARRVPNATDAVLASKQEWR